ncbi:hypothetical protein [Aliiroseovarius subalbicans]|uniref:tetratricopeptide repeat protein n=1 Tax=Aliiroseovarius subalbicans TaxID=2925840 RepID=UPI001F5ACB6F|nr:hypothetical protein [Aliiroseovarius subalbicans]MCI2399031.1 hypothetical protein [Aliiroseovarius subalbicans]
MPRDVTASLEALISEVQTAQSDHDARVVTGQMWDLWTAAPDEKAQALLETGREELRHSDFAVAEATFSELIAYCPNYAEGYNQRAFSHFLRGNFAAALPDLEAALERSPLHLAAMAGRFLTLRGLGREAEAQATLRQALALNPWLPERAFLTPIPGQEL